MITADQLRRRSLPSSYRSDGYDRAQVDHYLDLAAATLASVEQGTPGATAAAQMLLREVRGARFAARTSGAGYASPEVEALRAGVVATLEAYVGTDDAAAAEPATSPTAVPAPGPAPTRGAAAPARPTGAPTGSHDELSAFDLVMRVQSGRTALLASRGERIVVRTPDGALHAIDGVEATADGVELRLG
ncbi:DivIVA domain-containing protein [Cellulomonas sp. P22]|uniref:DivIVA domain-containing protein n=1 Tax=Cellulomonas sp. P22 TaxID=3373189 RepID=UPI00379DF348